MHCHFIVILSRDRVKRLRTHISYRYVQRWSDYFGKQSDVKLALRFMQEGAASILNAPVELRDSLVSQLNSECIRRNLSPGGSADIFAAALFLYSVDTTHLI